MPEAATTPAAADDGRLYRVHLCVMIFSEVEVRAASVPEAMAKAPAGIEGAELLYSCAPVATKAMVQRPIDYREPAKGFEWVEMVKRFSDPFDSSKGFSWVAKPNR